MVVIKFLKENNMVENTMLKYIQDLFKDLAFKEKILFFPNKGFAKY